MWLWVEVLSEVAVKVLARAAVLWRLPPGRRTCCLARVAGQPVPAVGGGLCSSGRASPRATWAASRRGAWLPPVQLVPETETEAAALLTAEP